MRELLWVTMKNDEGFNIIIWNCLLSCNGFFHTLHLRGVSWASKLSERDYQKRRDIHDSTRFVPL